MNHRKTGVQFPDEARSWLHRAGLSEEQKAVIIARTRGDLKRESVALFARIFLHEWRRHVRGVHRSSLLKVETLQVQRGKARNEKTNKTQQQHKHKNTNKKNQAKTSRVSALYIKVTHCETTELRQLAIWASNSRLSCCPCLWNGLVRSGLVRTGLITGACKRSARKHSNICEGAGCQFSSLRMKSYA